VIQINVLNNGMDFYFQNQVQAQKFTQFITGTFPMRTKISTKLVSTDSRNNTAHMKHITTCDLVPFCHDDLVLISTASSIAHGVAAATTTKLHGTGGDHGGGVGSSIHGATAGAKNGIGSRLVGRVVLITRMTSVMHVVDASPLRHRSMNQCMDEISPISYYQHEKQFTILQSSHRMVRFVVLDVEMCPNTTDSTSQNTQNSQNMEHMDQDSDNSHIRHGNNHDDESVVTSSTTALSMYNGRTKKKKSIHSKEKRKLNMATQYMLADVTVARESDMGLNDHQYLVTTHLGNMLQPGDIVLGYDLRYLTGAMWDELDVKVHGGYVKPEIVLVRKVENNDTLNHPPQPHEDEHTTIKSHDASAELHRTTSNNVSIHHRQVTKKQQRRQRRREGTKTLELEQAAERMGFIQDMDALAEPTRSNE
jgi:NMD protein affecting ribosome stability and mRNA decay